MIVAEQNLWRAWAAFRRGKAHRPAVRRFARHLERNLLSIRDDLRDGTWRHGAYQAFVVHDPKRRLVSVPSVRDQVVHQAIVQVIAPHIERRLSVAVTSSVCGRGIAAAVQRLVRAARGCAARRRPVAVLHGDIVRYFDSIPHDVLRSALRRLLACPRTLALLDAIIASFSAAPMTGGAPRFSRHGIPLGNRTSQVFANIMLMPLDWSVRAAGRERSYVRYADDFFLLGTDAHDLAQWRVAFERIVGSLGLVARFRIRGFHGCEALGRRFFTDGVAVRRSTRRRALHRLMRRVRGVDDGRISMSDLDASVASLRGLDASPRDVRWTTAIRDQVFPADFFLSPYAA